MRDLASIETLLTVLALHQAGSPTKAARTLGCAPSTVYRTLDRFEARLGTELFVRAAAGWTATAIGRQLADLAERLDGDIKAAELAIAQQITSTQVPIKISVSDSFADYVARVLAARVDDDADIAVEIFVENKFADLARREADIAIRPDMAPGHLLVGQRAGRMAHALYIAKHRLRQHAMPATADDLVAHPICKLSSTLPHFLGAVWWDMLKIPGTPRIALLTDTESALAAGIAGGAGVGLLPCFLGDQMPELTRLKGIKAGEPVDIWIVTHPALRRNRNVRRVMRTLANAIRKDARLFSGGR